MKISNLENIRIHPTAEVYTTQIGEGTMIWQFAVILPDAVLGKDCNVNAHVFIENKVTIGDRVTIKSGVYLWDGLTVENDVMIGPNVTFTASANASTPFFNWSRAFVSKNSCLAIVF